MIGLRTSGFFRLAVVFVALAVVAVACGGNGDDTAAQPKAGAVPDVPGAAEFIGVKVGSGEGLKIGYISLGESVPFVRLVSNGIRQQAEIARAELVFCDSAIDAGKALNCAKTFKTQGVDGYLNFQVFEDAASQICAQGPDVPVISIDIHQKPCEVAFMGADNERAGRLAGEAIGEFIKEEFNCEYDAYVSLESSQAGVVNELRMGGYRTGFEKFCPIENERVLDPADRIEPARAKFTDLLTALTEAERIVVVSINDDGIEGALAAARAAGREDDLWVSGQGADPSAWCEIKNNDHWIADSAYFPERYGEIGVPHLINAIKGEEVPEELFVPHIVVTGDNIDQFYEVKC